MKRAWIGLVILFALFGFSEIIEAKLIKIGTAVMNSGSGLTQSVGNAGVPVGSGGAGVPGGAITANEYNLIYDDDQGIIWLDYSNRGGGNWYGLITWASGLNAPGAVTCKFDPGISVTWAGDWRLPKTADAARTFGYDGTTTAGFNITTSEMGHLFYKSLGNLGYYDTKGKPTGAGWYPDSVWGLKNTGPFKNLQATMYWSGTEYSLFPLHAWAFNFAFGDQGNTAFKSSYPYLGIVVRPGKVTSSSTP
jgi:hypothetical protein